MAKIAFFDIEGWEKTFLKKKLVKHELLFFKDSLTEENVGSCKDCQAIGVFIYSKISSKILSKLPKLKLVTTLSTGFDHVDLKTCKNKGISVCNV
ncbi:hydroxyacid dehydrogenase, partial [Candidatus Micrarchaeota archaeon]|nr:hydroxyacid dehydrogenase [Candidatus Micrarchaeota archaeon]